MANDALLSVSGPVGAPGNPIEASSITADVAGTKGYVYVGTYKSCIGRLRITGSFDRTTGDETFQADVYEATDAAGTGAALVGSSASQTATHAANLGSSTANGKTAGTLSTGPATVGFSTGSGGWVGVTYNVGGTTPIVGGVAFDIEVLAGAVRGSGA